MQSIIAELTVDDVNASMYWYRELGFEVELRGLEDDDGLQWVSMGREGRSVWLLREDISRHEAGNTGGITFYLQVEDVDKLYHHLAEHGIETENRPQNQWYGLREFLVRDPDGFWWAINQSIPREDCPPHPDLGRRVGLL
ncbi:MAG: VOC family protein [Anaerolineae bacterium]|nr:VOC family protein [Anaerolineae bacterium]